MKTEKDLLVPGAVADALKANYGKEVPFIVFWKPPGDTKMDMCTNIRDIPLVADLMREAADNLGSK